jgi:hypothetical protein
MTHRGSLFLVNWLKNACYMRSHSEWPAFLAHGLRAAELVDLRGTPATHPLTGRELRALRRLQREQGSKSPFIFVSERGAPFSKRGFQAMVERAARTAGFDMKIHPHMLRHSCGIAAATNWRMTASIRAPSKAIWATSRSSIPSDTPSSRRRALRAYFGISRPFGSLVRFTAQAVFVGRATRSTHHGPFLSHCGQPAHSSDCWAKL